MSSLPALCYICCICLRHLLLETKEDGTRVQSGDREEERGNLSRKKAKGNEPKVERTAGGTNGRAQHPPTVAQIPLTLTQVYITVLGAFLSPDCERNEATDKTKTTRLPERSISCIVVNIKMNRHTHTLNTVVLVLLSFVV